MCTCKVLYTVYKKGETSLGKAKNGKRNVMNFSGRIGVHSQMRTSRLSYRPNKGRKNKNLTCNPASKGVRSKRGMILFCCKVIIGPIEAKGSLI